MKISKDEIGKYLEEVKLAIRQNRYQIVCNKNRIDNCQLFEGYVIVISFHEQKYPIKYYFK